MVDELLIINPHKLSFSEAGLRIMITPHFSPRTRLSMAGRMLISEVSDAHISCLFWFRGAAETFNSSPQRQRLIKGSKHQRDGEAAHGSRGESTSNSLKRTGSCSLENGGGRPRIQDTESVEKPGVDACRTEEEEEDDDGIFNPVRIPGEEDQISWCEASTLSEAAVDISPLVLQGAVVHGWSGSSPGLWASCSTALCQTVFCRGGTAGSWSPSWPPLCGLLSSPTSWCGW